MNRFITCCLSLCIFTGSAAPAQTSTYIGAEVAYSADIYSINDPGGRLSDADINSALWGATIRHVMRKYVFLETGIYARAYKLGIAFDNEIGSGGTDRTAVLVPLRVGGRLPLFKGALALCPVTGVTLAWANESQGALLDWASQMSGTDKIDYFYKVQYPAQVFPLFQAGMGIDIRLWPKGLLSLSTNYYAGVNKTLIQHIEYKVNNGPVTAATAYTRGSFYTIGIGFKHEVDWFK